MSVPKPSPRRSHRSPLGRQGDFWASCAAVVTAATVQPPTLLEAAHHEAAHAIAAMLTPGARQIDYVKLGECGGGWCGAVFFNEGHDQDWERFVATLPSNRMDAEGIVLAAGRVGTEVFGQGEVPIEHADDWCASDDQKLQTSALWRFRVDADGYETAPADRARWLAFVRSEAWKLVVQKWRYVTALARLLADADPSTGVTGAECVRLIQSRNHR